MNHDQEDIFWGTKVAVILNHPINNMSVPRLHVPGLIYTWMENGWLHRKWRVCILLRTKLECYAMNHGHKLS